MRLIFSRRRFIFGVVFPLSLLCLFYLLIGFAYSSGWRLNLSRSMPLGLYQIEPNFSRLQRGDLVVFCLPKNLLPTTVDFLQNGQCSSGAAPFFKSIVGIPGDHIETGILGVKVNGVLLTNSACLESVDLKCAYFNDALPTSEYWVFGYGSNPSLASHSFDSRYFGAIPASSILGVAR
ncbi:S26 family signal peptidase [Polynucleobacter sp. Fuers-14]|uniref:S26 family signal peptidase n=1 Tax=Polynucleobacter sp. Fuers-14 TaxID=1758364 RepID=UPI0035AF9B4F